jgi:hypothetical protein
LTRERRRRERWPSNRKTRARTTPTKKSLRAFSQLAQWRAAFRGTPLFHVRTDGSWDFHHEVAGLRSSLFLTLLGHSFYDRHRNRVGSDKGKHHARGGFRETGLFGRIRLIFLGFPENVTGNSPVTITV